MIYPNMRAMILAAGRGERMRPLTDLTPKPLLEIGGKSLIERHLDRLAGSGIGEVIINLAWLGEKIEAALGDGSRFGLRISYTHEPAGALETAGGIRAALDRLGPAPFLVVNGDVLCDYPLERLVSFEPAGLAHLVLVGNPSHHPEGDFALVDGWLAAGGEPRLTYSGIGVFRPEMFESLPHGRRALRPVLDRAVAGGEVSGEHHTGLWADVGDPERLQALRERFARR